MRALNLVAKAVNGPSFQVSSSPACEVLGDTPPSRAR